MAEPRLERVSEVVWRISGEMSFATVAGLLKSSERMFADASGALEVDLSAVSRADSAGLVLLIEWLRQAKGLGREIRYVGVPQQMMAIAVASDLEEVLPIAVAG